MRIQLDVAKDHLAEIKFLMQKTNCETYKEFFNNAMTLLKWAVTQKSQGRSLYSVDQATDTWIELQMPALEYCAKAGAEKEDAAARLVANS